MLDERATICQQYLSETEAVAWSNVQKILTLPVIAFWSNDAKI